MASSSGCASPVLLAVEPEVLLMDEPTSALDPISTSRIEDLMGELKEKYTIVIVTHNMQQAGRISDKTAFFLHGEIVEYDTTDQDLFQARRQADGRLYHRPFRLMRRERIYPCHRENDLTKSCPA